MSTLLRLLFTFYFIVFVLIIFVVFIADNDRDDTLGEISRLITAEIPSKFVRLLQSICGKKVTTKFNNFKNYLLNEKNSVFQISYLVIINAAYLTWMIYGYPYLPASKCPQYHNPLSLIGVILSQLSFFKVCSASAGDITTANLDTYLNIPYDGLLYLSGQTCKTCKVIKVRHSFIFFLFLL